MARLLEAVRERSVECARCPRQTWHLSGVCGSKRCRDLEVKYRINKIDAVRAPHRSPRLPGRSGEASAASSTGRLLGSTSGVGSLASSFTLGDREPAPVSSPRSLP